MPNFKQPGSKQNQDSHKQPDSDQENQPQKQQQVSEHQSKHEQKKDQAQINKEQQQDKKNNWVVFVSDAGLKGELTTPPLTLSDF